MEPRRNLPAALSAYEAPMRCPVLTPRMMLSGERGGGGEQGAEPRGGGGGGAGGAGGGGGGGGGGAGIALSAAPPPSFALPLPPPPPQSQARAPSGFSTTVASLQQHEEILSHLSLHDPLAAARLLLAGIAAQQAP
eukprot:1739354-Rhodomonas_salina.7